MPVLAALAGLPMLVLLVAGGIASWLQHSTFQPAPARAVQGLWLGREAMLREQLRRTPRNERAQIQLAAVLVAQALEKTQREYPTERAGSHADAVALEGWSAQAFQRSPQLAAGRQLAEAVARHGRDRGQRATAWATLTWVHRLLRDESEALACMEAAAREDAAYGDALATLKERVRGVVRW